MHHVLAHVETAIGRDFWISAVPYNASNESLHICRFSDDPLRWDGLFQESILSEIYSNGYLTVDTFLFIGGLLVGYLFFKEVDKNRKRIRSLQSWILYYVHRYFRFVALLGLERITLFSLTPPYMLFIAFGIAYFPFVENDNVPSRFGPPARQWEPLNWLWGNPNITLKKVCGSLLAVLVDKCSLHQQLVQLRENASGFISSLISNANQTFSVIQLPGTWP